MVVTMSTRTRAARTWGAIGAGVLLVGLVVAGVLVVRQLGAAPAKLADVPTVTGSGALEAGLEAARVYMQQQRYAEASAVLEALAKRSPEDDGVRVLLAQSLLGEKKFAAAYAEYEAAIAVVTRTSPSKQSVAREGAALAATAQQVLSRRDPKLAELHFEAGTVASELGRLERAQEHYWMAQAVEPGDARYPLYLAMVQVRRGESDAAGASLLRAVKLKPDLPEAWGTMAELELKNNRINLAAQHLEQALRLQPGETRWRLVQARILNRQDRAEQAATTLLALTEAERRKPEVLGLLSESYGLLGKPGEAGAAYAQAFRASPDKAEFAYQAALWFERAKDVARAREMARAAGMMGHADAQELEVRLATP